MRPVLRQLALILLAGLALPVFAASAPALRAEFFVSSDSDGTRSQSSALGWDVQRHDIAHWWGFKAERVRFSGAGWRQNDERLFVQAAGGEGKWRWRGAAGTDGKDLLGSASVFSEEARRKELFLERGVLETREGLRLGRVHTYAGGALDWPISDRWSANGLVGLQDFGADNLRRHLRGSLVYSALPELGLSVQLRLRQFNDSDPRELDYFAPGRYRQALGVVSMRRFSGGYQWRITAGAGRQSFTGAGSQASRLFELDFQTPQDRGYYLRATAGYSDAPANSGTGGGGYHYRYARLEAVWAL